jgi:TPR repeat protein
MQAAGALPISAVVAVVGLFCWSGLAADAAERKGSQTPNPALGAKGQADYELGVKYLNGDGVERDETKGAALIRRAAEAGLAEA